MSDGSREQETLAGAGILARQAAVVVVGRRKTKGPPLGRAAGLQFRRGWSGYPPNEKPNENPLGSLYQMPFRYQRRPSYQAW